MLSYCTRCAIRQVWRYLLTASLLLVALLVALMPQVAAAQGDVVATGSGWSPQSKIPGYFSRTLPPKMVVDQDRTVHAFATMPLTDDPADGASEDYAIYYSQWTLKDGWSKPNDILLSPVKQQARVEGVFLDHAGVIHLVFFGGDEQTGNLYYTWAPAQYAGRATAWAEPVVIGEKPITPDAAVLAGDGQGNLVTVYSGNLGEGNSLYAVYSEDGGVTWSEPGLVFSTYTLTEQVFDLQTYLGASGALHMVWNVTDSTGQNVGGYYAQMNNLHDRVWTTPIPIDTSVGLGLAIPAVIEYKGSIIIVYNNGVPDMVPPVQWMRRSDDGGKTWSPPIRPFPNHIGRNGTISLVVDGAGVLHVFFGQRTGGSDETPATHGMWHSVWNNGWGPLQPVVSGPQGESFDPYDARAVVSQGNTILLTWRTDPGRRDSWSYFATTTLDVPEQPVEPLPTPALAVVPAQVMNEPAPTPVILPTLIPEVTGGVSTPRPQFSSQPAPEETGGPAAPVVGALTPTVLFVIAALIVGSLRHRR